MPYPQDLLNKYINYRVDPGGNMSDGMNGQLVNGVLPNQTTAAAVAVLREPVVNPHARRGAIGGLQDLYQNTNMPWNFTFLKYFGGAVTVAPLAGAVLTGPMSGCFLCRYSQNGVPHIAHIGTANSADSVASIAVKDAWKTFVARPDVSQVSGGNPFDYFTTGEIQKAMNGGHVIPDILGYFSAGTSFALLVAKVPQQLNPPGMTLLRVAGVKTMTLQPWASLAALRTFR
jgi:hypothetical protein